MTPDDIEKVRSTISAAAVDQKLVVLRKNLAILSADVFLDVGTKLFALGHIIGDDRKSGASPFNHGNDEVVGMSVLLRIGGQLVSASAELLTEGRPYAGAALLRQIVEIEYLAWAFEARDKDAERWLRSDHKIREELFRPAKLRKASGTRFRGKDYGFHCEMGGHPVPMGTILLDGDDKISQLLLADLLGHVSRSWAHFVGWAQRNHQYTSTFMPHNAILLERFQEWWKLDPMVNLPPVP